MYVRFNLEAMRRHTLARFPCLTAFPEFTSTHPLSFVVHSSAMYYVALFCLLDWCFGNKWPRFAATLM
jgi:hypothetical protein